MKTVPCVQIDDRLIVSKKVIFTTSYLVVCKTAWNKRFFWRYFPDLGRGNDLPIPLGSPRRKIYNNCVVRFADNTVRSQQVHSNKTKVVKE